jgi:ubiquinone/menaquinone biosynthesis C-methylase UbiE
MMADPQSIWYLFRRQIRTFLVLCFCFAPAGFAFQSEHPISGRKIAPVMGVAGADWLDRNERESEENPDAALDAIGIKPGMVVADVGAGTGYMTLKMASRIGPTGKVYAEDVQPEMLRRLRRNAVEAKLNNIQTVLGGEADPKLPPDTLDLILLVDVYHEFSQPQRMLRKMRESLKQDGRLVLLEYRKEDPSIPIRPEHKMSVQEVKLELEAEGFHLDKVLETLPRQHILILTKARVQ